MKKKIVFSLLAVVLVLAGLGGVVYAKDIHGIVQAPSSSGWGL